MSFSKGLVPLRQLPLWAACSAVNAILRHARAGPLKLAVRKWVGSARPREGLQVGPAASVPARVCYRHLLKTCLSTGGAVAACDVAAEEMGGARRQERSPVLAECSHEGRKTSLPGVVPRGADWVCAWGAGASPSQRSSRHPRDHHHRGDPCTCTHTRLAMKASTGLWPALLCACQ